MTEFVTVFMTACSISVLGLLNICTSDPALFHSTVVQLYCIIAKTSAIDPISSLTQRFAEGFV